MILINEILVDEKISETHFSCDLTICKGACCTFPGEYGAPVLYDEIELIKASLPVAIEYLSQKSINAIEKEGMITEINGHYFTSCIDKKDCVFVYYDGDIALCSLEKAYLDGKSQFRKPVSCHLFPIRVANFGGEYIYYEKIDECSPAIESGRKKNLKIFDSVKDALIRAFGEEWYDSYLDEINNGVLKR